MEMKHHIPSTERPGRFHSFFRMIRTKIGALFTPEEVEVTFKREGNKVTYTYTKVDHKQVA